MPYYKLPLDLIVREFWSQTTKKLIQAWNLAQLQYKVCRTYSESSHSQYVEENFLWATPFFGWLKLPKKSQKLSFGILCMQGIKIMVIYTAESIPGVSFYF